MAFLDSSENIYQNNIFPRAQAMEQKLVNQSFKNSITVLRPALKNHLSADKFAWLKNKKAKKNIKEGECINIKKVSI